MSTVNPFTGKALEEYDFCSFEATSVDPQLGAKAPPVANTTPDGNKNDFLDDVKNAFPFIEDLEGVYDDTKGLIDEAKDWYEETDDNWGGALGAVEDFAKGWIKGGLNGALNGVANSDMIRNPLNEAAKAGGDAIEEGLGGAGGFNITTPLGIGYDKSNDIWYGFLGVDAREKINLFTIDATCTDFSFLFGGGAQLRFSELGPSIDPTLYAKLNMKLVEYSWGPATINVDAFAQIDALNPDANYGATATIDIGAFSQKWNTRR